MKITPDILLLAFLLISNEATSCLFGSEDPQDSWETRKYIRKNKHCYCGMDLDYRPDYSSHFSKPWQFYIHVKNSDDPLTKTVCMGTLIASNLIATSAKCLTWKMRKINLYDAWDPKFKVKNVAKARDVEVYTHLDKMEARSRRVVVDKITYHPRYIESVIHGRFPHGDLALLRIHKHDSIIAEISEPDVCDPIGNCTHRPICLPSLAEADDLVHQFGYYYGIGGADTEIDKEIRFSERTLILPGSQCDKQLNLESNSNTVCIKFRLSAPEVEGGPLIINSAESDNTAILVGLASWVGDRHTFPSAGFKYAYFSHIKSMIQYIEQQADFNNSTFCLQRHSTILRERTHSSISENNYPWEDEQGFERKTSEDCVCGHSNKGLPQARIIGGVEAHPREFGWLAKIAIKEFTHSNPNNPLEKSLTSCGGTIINDRIVLTAAHCFINPEIHVDNITVYVKSHMRVRDPKEVALKVSEAISHPEFDTNDKFGVTDYDIALLVLTEPLKFMSLNEQKADSVVPICIPEQDKHIDFIFENATVAGWGLNTTDQDTLDYYFESALPDVLLKVSNRILPLSLCRMIAFAPLSTNNICGSIVKEKDAAEGDSGGPLMVMKQIDPFLHPDETTMDDWHWLQVGVVSIGHPGLDVAGQGVESVAAVYTNIQEFVNFIDYYSHMHGATWCKFEDEPIYSDLLL